MFLNIKQAFSASFLAGILLLPIYGFKIVKDGNTTILDSRLGFVALVLLTIFILTLLRPTFGQISRVFPKKELFFLDNHQQKRAIVYFFLVAALFPFILIVMQILFPGFEYRNYIVIGSMALTYIILGLGLNIVVGYAGLLNLGYVAFYAIGGYTFGYLFKLYGFSFWMSVPFSIIAAAFAGFLISLLLLRLKGDYLAIVTLAFAEILRQILNNYYGGPNGISGLPKPTFFGYPFLRRGQETFHKLFGLNYNGAHLEIFIYFVGFIFAIMTAFVSLRLLKMPLGRALEALREDEIACQAIGINPTPIKVWAFTIGAAIAGAAGAYFGTRQTMVNPESFQFIESIMILAAVVLGGMGSNFGVIIASLLIVILQELGRGLQEYRMLIFGLVLVIMMIWRPQGLLPAKRSSVETSS